MFGRKNIDFQSDYTSGSAPSQNTSPKCARWNSIGLSLIFLFEFIGVRRPLSSLPEETDERPLSSGEKSPSFEWEPRSRHAKRPNRTEKNDWEDEEEGKRRDWRDET